MLLPAQEKMPACFTRPHTKEPPATLRIAFSSFDPRRHHYVIPASCPPFHGEILHFEFLKLNERFLMSQILMIIIAAGAVPGGVADSARTCEPIRILSFCIKMPDVDASGMFYSSTCPQSERIPHGKCAAMPATISFLLKSS